MQRANGKRSEQTCRTRHGTAHRGRGAYRLKPSALRGKIAVVAAWRGSPTGSDGRSTKQNHVMLNFFLFFIILCLTPGSAMPTGVKGTRIASSQPLGIALHGTVSAGVVAAD
jgi:hypothetical protein